jgi:hypothetical protein
MRDRRKYHKNYLKMFPWKCTLRNIKQRCNNPKNPCYKNYGGRGITCLITENELKELWFRDKAYEMKQPSIDRKNSNGNYEFNNCQYLEQRDNIGKANKETKSRIILQFAINNKFIKEWESISEASRKLNIIRTSINNSLNYWSKTSGGFIWRYK